MHATLRTLGRCLPALLIPALIGCADSTPPQPALTGDTERPVGFVDPGLQSFVLESIRCAVPGEDPVRIDLIGRNLRVHPEGDLVSLEVAVHNADRRSLYAPLEVLATRFVPESVGPTNADRVRCPDPTPPPDPPGGGSPDDPDSTAHRIAPGVCLYGFDYSLLAGADGCLAADDTSAFRSWELRAPGLRPFSFSAAVRFVLEPEDPPQGARIAGRFFHDANENARPDPDEEPFGGGWVVARGPGIEALRVAVEDDGWYSLAVRQAGLYTLAGLAPPTQDPQGVRFTTPNPLEVLLVPGLDGEPQSFRGAHFGLVRGQQPGEHPRVVLTDALPDSVPRDPYGLLRAGIEGDLLIVRAGYSGCQPRHPFHLFMLGGFRESWPVQARLVLTHDGLEERCDAYFESTLRFDLTPIRRAYLAGYGEPGTVILRLEDSRGQVHTLRYVL